MNKPNILLIFTDQWRYDYLSCLENGKCPTPNLDRLAEEGTLFTRCVTPNPVCQPARAALLTGRYPHQIGLTVQNGDLRQDIRTMPQALQEAGYITASIGKLHYHHSTRPQNSDELPAFLELQKKFGFDHIGYFSGCELKGAGWCSYYDILKEAGLVDEALAHGKRVDQNAYNNNAPLETRWPGEAWPLPEELHLDNVVGSHVIEYLKDYSDDKPFYLQTTFSGPHPPFNAPRSWVDKLPYEEIDDFIVPDGETLSEEQKKSLWNNRHLYKGMMACIDDWVGKMIDVLEEKALFENTLIALTSDHGEMMGDHLMYNKQVPYKESSRIPLIIKWPGINKGIIHNGMTELTDLSSTLLDAAGLDQKESLNTPGLSFHGRLPGKSLKDIVTGTCDIPVRKYSFSVGQGAWSMIESEQWKYVRRVKDEIAGETVEELYDLRTDPSELINRINDPACTDIMAEHKEALLRIYESSPCLQSIHEI